MPEDKDEKKSEPAAAEAARLVDEAYSAAADTRKAAQWVATALGGVPALALVTSLVKGPGEGGFEEGWLFLGLGFGAAGAVLGVFALAKVMEPVEATDQKLRDAAFDVQRVPGHPFPSYAFLRRRLADLRDQYTRDAVAASDAELHAKRASAVASLKEAELKAAEQRLGDPKDDKGKAELARFKAARDEAQARASAATLDAAAVSVALGLTKERLNAAEAVRGRSLQLYTADVVRRWYADARAELLVAIAAVVLGIFLLAISSQPKDEAAAAAGTTLVSLSLNPVGQEALGCPLTSVQGLRVGEEDGIPLVITLPTEDCEAAVLRFQEEEPSTLGSMTEVSPAPAAAE